MVESASRSSEKPTPQKIEQLVNDLIDQRLADHQLDECDLTLRDLRTIAERFRFTLMNMLHTRIAYPKEGKTSNGTSDEANGRARCDGGTKRPGFRATGFRRLTSGRLRDRAGARIWRAGCDRAWLRA